MTSVQTPAVHHGPARAGLGHRLGLQRPARQAVPARLLRPHRLDRHLALDRSVLADVRDLPLQPQSPGRERQRGAVARAARHAGGRGDPGFQFRLRARRPGCGAGARKRGTDARPQPDRNQPSSGRLNGIDVLEREKFAPLKGLRVGLITNHTGQDRDRNPTIDLLRNAPGVELKALFSPEHGIRGAVDEKVGDSVDQKTGLPVYSLYGATIQADAGTTQGPGRAGVRHPGHRLPVLHLHRHHGPDTGSRRREREEILRARPRQPDQRRDDRRPGADGQRHASWPSTRCRCATA